MNVFSEILTYVIQTLGSLYLGAVLLRFFLQLCRADFYNPISQTIVKVTNPLLIPLRRIIPGVFGIDIASIFLALLLQVIIGEVNYFVAFQQIGHPGLALTFAILGTLKMCTYLVFAAIIILVISSFVAPFSSHPVIVLARQLMDPLMRPIQRLLPPMGGLDLSVLFIAMGNRVIQMLLDAAAYNFGLVSTSPLSFLVIGY